MKHIRIHALIMILVCLALATSAEAWTLKRLTKYQKDSDATLGANRPSLAASGNSIYAVWGLSPFILFKRSTNGGATWSAERRMSRLDSAARTGSVAASGSNVYIAYDENTPGNYEIYLRKSTDNGARWSAPMRLSNTQFASGNPRVGASNQYVYVVWHDYTTGSGDIYFRRSADYGATWSRVKRLTNTATASEFPGVSADGSNVYVVWDESSSDVFIRKSADAGNTWSGKKRLSSPAASPSLPSVAASGDNVFAVWSEYSGGYFSIIFRSSSDGGATWSPRKRLTRTSSAAVRPSVFAIDSGVHVSWEQIVASEEEIYYRHSPDNGLAWLRRTKLSFASGVPHWPAVTANSDRVSVAWTVTLAGEPDLYLKYSDIAALTETTSGVVIDAVPATLTSIPGAD